jgi:hypothetical protein
MANLNETINVNDTPEAPDFSPIPAGDYHVKVAEASLETTKKGDGQYIKLRLDVIGPSYEGRVLFANINIRNPNPKAEEIGRQQLGSIMRAVGLSQVSDTDQLIGGQMIVTVKISHDEQYGDRNEVKSFKAPQGSPAPGPQAQQASAQEAPSTSVPPWQR